MPTYQIADIIGSPIAISPAKAEKLYNHFKQILVEKRSANYSVKGLEDCSSAFCNASIGRLYMEYNVRDVKQAINFIDFNDDNHIWEEKINRAILLGSDEKYRRNSQNSLNELMS